MANLLLVITDVALPSASESAIQSRLSTTLGHDVQSIAAEDAALRTTAESKDAIVWGPFSNPQANASLLADLAKPILTLDGNAAVSLGVAGSRTNANFTNINIVDAAHAVAGGLAAGVHILKDGEASNFEYTTILGAGANLVGTQHNNTARYNFYVYETGGELADATTAAARRVTYGVPGYVAEFNANGWALFDASVAWMLEGAVEEPTGVSTVEVRLDGGAWVAATGTETWSYDLNMDAVTAGEHTIEARATDGAGNVSTIVSETFWHSPDGTWVYGNPHLIPANVQAPSVSEPIELGVVRGINDAGGEFGAPGPLETPTTFSNVNSGTYNTTFHYSSQATHDYLAARGMEVIRVPFRWERAQPTLNGPLDTTEINRLKAVCDQANNAGLKVMLDVHNYAAYWLDDAGQGVRRAIGSDELPISYLADFWSRMATEFKDHPALLAYTIMNEPVGMPTTGGAYVPETVRADFEADNESWTNATHDAALAYNGSGSISRTVTLGAGWGMTTVNSPVFTARPANEGGATYEAWVYIPPDAPDVWWLAKILLRKTDFTWMAPADTHILRGQWNRITYTPDAAEDINMIQLQVGASDINATVKFNFDYVTQGTDVPAKQPQVLWEEASQAAVDAIRAVDTVNTIIIPGYNYSGVENWTTLHPNAWITDPNDNIVYEAHQYFDNSTAGQYPHSYAEGVTHAEGQGYTAGDNADANITRALERLSRFTDWCVAEGVQGYIGEVGWPGTTSFTQAESDAWNGLGEAWYTAADAAGIWVTYWATGEWWGNYHLAPYYHTGGTNGVVDTASSQAPILEAHLG